MQTSPHLQLPLLAAAQAQKHVTHNEAILALDALVHLSVSSRAVADPPPSAEDRARFIVASPAAGDWAGREGDVAVRLDGAWRYFSPGSGWRAWVEDEAVLLVHDGAAWRSASEPVNPAPFIGVNTIADPTNRFAAKSDAILLSHDDVTPGSGDIRATMNKAAAGNTVSLIYQSAWSGRAELGLAGDEDFRVRVSPDGADGRDAIVFDRQSGKVAMPQGRADMPVFSADISDNDRSYSDQDHLFLSAVTDTHDAFDAATSTYLVPETGTYMIGCSSIPRAHQGTSYYKLLPLRNGTAISTAEAINSQLDLTKVASFDFVTFTKGEAVTLLYHVDGSAATTQFWKAGLFMVRIA